MNDEETTAGGTDPKKPLILVVDDDESVSQIMIAVLEARGFRVIHAEDAEKALKTIHELASQPDLMITDFFMPNISGLKLIQQARTRFPLLKTVLTTGEVDEPEIQDPESRPNGWLSKPFSPRELIASVHQAMGREL